jgi:dsRNA-specific ribonuclease
MDQKSVELIERKIGYIFRNETLLEQAFTRSSYAHEHDDVQDNEVLEFIGDEALDFIVTKELIGSYSRWKNEVGYYRSPLDQGRLTELKKNCVDSSALSKCIGRLGLVQYLRMGNGDIAGHVELQQSVKEDLFEAIVGAVTLDSNWDLQAIRILVTVMQAGQTELTSNVYYREESLWKYNQKKNAYLQACEEKKSAEDLQQLKDEVEFLWGTVENEAEQDYDDAMSSLDPNGSDDVVAFVERPLDYVGMLQRYIQAYKADLPSYSYTQKSRNGALTFTCTCQFALTKEVVVFTYTASNQKQARQGAAQKGYQYCRDYFENVIGADIDEVEYSSNEGDAKKLLSQVTEDNAVSTLNRLYQLTWFDKPVYSFSSKQDENDALIWTCTCSFANGRSFNAQAPSKNAAKKKASFLAVKQAAE